MKTLNLFILILIIMSSCNNSSTEVARLKAETDSLEKVIAQLQSQLPMFLELPDTDISVMLEKYSNMPDKFIPSIQISADNLNHIYQQGKNSESVRMTIGTTTDNMKCMMINYPSVKTGQCADMSYKEYVNTGQDIPGQDKLLEDNPVKGKIVKDKLVTVKPERCCIKCDTSKVAVVSSELIWNQAIGQYLNQKN